MADIVRWSPYDEMTRMRDEFSRLFTPFFAGSAFPTPGAAWGPSVDVRETDASIEVSVEIPGISPGDLDVTICDDSVTIRGEIKHEADTNQQGFRRIERRYGSFQRTIPFPIAVQHEQATAEYQNGILHIKAPKAEVSKPKMTKLRINGTQGQGQLQ